MSKFLVIVFFLLKISNLEKYSYKVLYEKSLNTAFDNSNIFEILDGIETWNLSFWFRVNSCLTFVEEIFKIKNSLNLVYSLIIDPNTFQIFFDGNKLGYFEIENSINDFIDLVTFSKKWIFFSFNYTFKKFNFMLPNSNIEIIIPGEYLFDNNAQIIFRDNSSIWSNCEIFLAHVHFFEMEISFEDLNQIKFYPQKLKAIYKFSDFSSSDLIINSFDFINYRNIKITNNKKIPFKNNNSYVDVKIDFPSFNESIVFKNLIISINGSISFRNFIKANNSYENIYWIINWYIRKTENNANNINFQTRISYSTIKLNEHKVKFESIQSQDNLSPNFLLGNNYSLNIGDWKRKDFNLDILTIIQIKDIPLPNNQNRLKEFKCKIPILNYLENLNYDFDLSFYDNHYFKIDFNSLKPVLMYFILNEFLVYTGDTVDWDENNENIYLGKEKKILIKCPEHHNLLRNYPDYNERLF